MHPEPRCSNYPNVFLDQFGKIMNYYRTSYKTSSSTGIIRNLCVYFLVLRLLAIHHLSTCHGPPPRPATTITTTFRPSVEVAPGVGFRLTETRIGAGASFPPLNISAGRRKKAEAGARDGKGLAVFWCWRSIWSMCFVVVCWGWSVFVGGRKQKEWWTLRCISLMKCMYFIDMSNEISERVPFHGETWKVL